MNTATLEKPQPESGQKHADSRGGNGRRTREGFVMGFVLLIAFTMTGMLFWPSRWWWEPQEESTCAAGDASAGAPNEDAAVVPLEVTGSQEPILRLGRSRGARSLTVALSMGSLENGSADDVPVLPNGTVLETTPRTFQRSDGATMPSRAIVSTAQVVGNQVDLNLCVQPEQGPASPVPDGNLPTSASPVAEPVISGESWDIHPGTYTGSVAITDPRVAPITVQITVMRSFVRWWSVLALAVLSSMAGVVWLYLLRTGESVPSDRRFGNLEFAGWLGRRDSLISVATGLVGVSAVYTGTYLKAEDWGATSTAFLALVGAVFTAFITAATAGKLASNPGGPPAATD